MSLFLGTVIGWFLVIMGLLFLFRFGVLQTAMRDVMSQRGLFFMMAIITVILGLFLVTSHNVWVLGWPLLITLISWFVLITGILRLFFPEQAIQIGKSFVNHPNRIKIGGIILLIIGVFLLFNVYYFYFEAFS